MGEMDWRVLGQLLVYAFGAGAIVQQLRNLNKTVDALKVEFREAHTALTKDVVDLKERTSSLEEFRRFMQRGE
jgi:hypothetical protein